MPCVSRAVSVVKCDRDIALPVYTISRPTRDLSIYCFSFCFIVVDSWIRMAVGALRAKWLGRIRDIE